MKHPAILTLLLFLGSSSAMDPPALLWEMQYDFPGHSGSWFRDIERTPTGDLFVTGVSTDFSNPDTVGHCAFLFDQDGNVLWKADYTRFSMFGQDGAILPDGSMVVTGYGQAEYGSSRELFIMKLDTDGNAEWTKIYDYPETKEEGYGITCLPDGGFAVCGKVNGTGQWAGEAWLLRTDAQGDTLWTATWGTDIENYGKVILFSNNEFCMLTKGGIDSLSQGDTHLVFFDTNGNYIRATDYPELYNDFPRGMCLASDGGYTFVTDANPVLWHTDQYGETLWWHSIYNYGVEEGYDVIRTMDSGYLFCGWGGQWQEPAADTDCMQIPSTGMDTGWTQDAWLVKFDEEGNQQWEFKREAQTTHCHYYSVVQLPEGGYIACGLWSTSGYLARFAPETGIAEPDPSTSLSLEVFPNPFSSTLSVTFSLQESGTASLQVYDLSGRLVDTAADAVFPAGENTVEWVVPELLSSGCYIVRLETETEHLTRTCALIR